VSGFYVLPKSPAGHTADPAKDTWRSAQGGAPADLLSDADYPITAVCATCGGSIRLDRKLQMEWRHLPAEGGAR
jgi:hypothetical protein